MGKLVLSCPKCKGKLTAPEGVERFRCPTCKTVLTAPKEPGPLALEGEAAAPTPRPSEPEGPALGEKLSGYTITRLIGRGGMGTVYEAIQEGLKRRVAIKVLPQAVSQDATFLASFKREAQATAKLNHPNIVQIFDIDQDKGYQFFSMEFVPGESLADRLARQKRIPLPEALGHVAQAAAALEHACEHMLIHRDIKPSNILLTERGDVKLADLGLSKSLEETAIGIARGTHGGPIYMAPEFSKNPQIADCRSDIYALGAVLFHALTGRPPFPGPTVADLIRQHANEPFPSARAVAPEVPEPVDALIQKMSAKDPAARFQTHGELLGQLRALLKTTAVRMPRIVRPKPLEEEKKPRRRNWLPFVIGGVAAVAAIAGIVVLLLGRPGSPRPKAALTSAAAAQPQKPEKPPGPKPPVPPPSKTKEPPPEPKPEKPTPPPEKRPDQPVEPKEPKEQPKEEPKPPEGGDWQAKLDAAKKAADALAAQSQFGKALEALDAVAKGNDAADVKEAVDKAKQPIQEQAAKAFEAEAKKAYALAKDGKYDEAKALLQAVADKFGAEDQVSQAKTGIAALDAHKQALDDLAKAAAETRTAAEAAARRAKQQADLAKTLDGLKEPLEGWKLAEAVAELDKLKFDDEGLAAQVAQRKAAIEALIAFRDAVVQHIKNAPRRMQKRDLKIPGLNGDITDVNKDGLTAQTKVGDETKAEKFPWGKLPATTVEALAKSVGKPGEAADQLAVAFWLHLLGNEEKAQAAFNRAAALGAKSDALGDPAKAVEKAEREAQAARALADAIQLFAQGKAQDTAAALGAYKEKFGDTANAAANERLLESALAFKPLSLPGVAETPVTPDKPEPKPEPKPPVKLTPGDEQKARELYDKAAVAFKARRFEETRKLLDELKAKFDGSVLFADAKLNPTVASMLAAVGARGQLLKVSPRAKDAHATIEKAIAAIEKPPATIEVEPGNYRGPIAPLADQANGLILRGAGDSRPRIEGSGRRDVVIRLPSNAKDILLENLELAYAKTGIDIGNQSSLGLNGCVALLEIGTAYSKPVTSKLTIEGCAFAVDGVSDTPVKNSALRCTADAVLDASQFTNCVLVGTDLQLRQATLTDCLLIGSAVLESNTKLTHVTVIGALTATEDSRGIVIQDSIIASLEITKPKRKVDKKGIVVKLDNVVLIAQQKPLAKDLVESVEVNRGRVPFINPSIGDYRLAKDSPLRTKASDKTELGCHFAPELIEILKLAHGRSASFLRPPASGKH